jgi:hypothetical protein
MHRVKYPIKDTGPTPPPWDKRDSVPFKPEKPTVRIRRGNTDLLPMLQECRTDKPLCDRSTTTLDSLEEAYAKKPRPGRVLVEYVPEPGPHRARPS